MCLVRVIGWVSVSFVLGWTHSQQFGPLFWVYRNTDKMSDEEKLPIAIAGVAFIALPFIAGLIALYAAQS